MIRTPRFELDILRRDDVTAQREILAILSHPDFSGFMGLGPYNSTGNKSYISDAVAMNEDASTPSCIMTIKQDGRCIGVLDSADDHGEPDLGYFIAPSEWGKGIAKECVPPFVRHLFETKPIRLLTATSHPDNAASAKLLQSLGFARSGTKPRPYNDGHAESLTWILPRERFMAHKPPPPVLGQ